MKRTRPPIILVAGVAALVATIAVTPAHAGNPCLSEAKRDYRDCTADCKEAFQTAKDACLNRDHACVEVCRADRSQCRLDTGFDAAIEACNDLLEARRIRCRQDNPPGEERDRCIDLAQIEAFQCRDAARELAKPLLKQCRKAFRACARACGPAAAGDPPPDPRQCLTDANIAFRACLKSEDAAAPGCRESFQIAKDDCRGRDHECVEACRAARHACRLPIRAQLAADLAACAATRRDGIDGCDTATPPPRDTPEEQLAYDQCVDPIQVDAFICRDDAHEAARPGFGGCRGQFRTCVETNCPELP